MSPRHSSHADRYDNSEEGNAIGLTRAFSPIDDANSYGFDDASDADAYSEGYDFEAPEDAFGASEEDVERYTKHGRHARHAAPEPAYDAYEEDPLIESDYGNASYGEDPFDNDLYGEPSSYDLAVMQGGELASTPAEKDEVPAYLRKSKRMRVILIVVIILLIVLLGAGSVLTWQLIQMAQSTATQQTQSTTIDSAIVNDGEAKDASTATKKTTVPSLISLLGMTQDEAVAYLQHGAQVSLTREVNEEGNPIKSEVRVALTAEPSDTRSGTPTVYLGLNEEGIIIQAGYSASTTSLGYGPLSFTDAVRNENIIEKTLEEAGVYVAWGTATLPEDKMEYSTYASDGTTLTREYCSFAGDTEVNGTVYNWSAVLSYDYSAANATENLANTVRVIYVYVGV